MPPLSTLQLAMERRIERDAMTETCTIVTHSLVPDGAGGSTVIETTLEVACRTEPRIANTAESSFGGQLMTGLQWDFFLPYDTEITTNDEIIYQGQTFGVMTVLGPRTDETSRQVIAVEKSA